MYAPGPQPPVEPHAHRHPSTLAAVAALALVPAALLVASAFPMLTLGAILGAALPRIAATATAGLPTAIGVARQRPSPR